MTGCAAAVMDPVSLVRRNCDGSERLIGSECSCVSRRAGREGRGEGEIYSLVCARGLPPFLSFVSTFSDGGFVGGLRDLLVGYGARVFIFLVFFMDILISALRPSKFGEREKRMRMRG